MAGTVVSRSTLTLMLLTALVGCDGGGEGVVSREDDARSFQTVEVDASEPEPKRPAPKIDAEPPANASAAGALYGPDQPPPSPLDDLLRLPRSITDEHRELADDESRLGEADVGSDEARDPGRLRLEVETREDVAGFDPDRQRRNREAEAGVAIEVDESTSVRGGVRAGQQDDEDWTEPVPKVGVEKRF